MNEVGVGFQNDVIEGHSSVRNFISSQLKGIRIFRSAGKPYRQGENFLATDALAKA